MMFHMTDARADDSRLVVLYGGGWATTLGGRPMCQIE